MGRGCLTFVRGQCEHVFVTKFPPKGPPDRAELERLAGADLTLREIASSLNRSIATVRYWLDQWKIARPDTRRRWMDPSIAPPVIQSRCATHGEGPFRLEGRGYYRCKECRKQRVIEWRRRAKSRLIAEAGGCCQICGYKRYNGALHFHHRDPGLKEFALSRGGWGRAIEKLRAEAAKCVLLCSNCHAEVERESLRFRRRQSTAM